ncbi:hypothetical protein Plhal703r1_c14g0068411 [Plasmopara halstedii]
MISITQTSSSSQPRTFEQSLNVQQQSELVHDCYSRSPQKFLTFANSFKVSDNEEKLLTLRQENSDISVTKQSERSNTDNGNQHSNTPTKSPYLQSLRGEESDPPASFRTPQGSKNLLSSSMSASILVSARLRKSGGNSADIVKRLKVLGTQVSTSGLSSTPYKYSGLTTDSLSRDIRESGSLQGTSISQAGKEATSSAPAPLNVPEKFISVMAAEDIRNAFNLQPTRMSYGCSVALELFNGNFMMVGSPEGKVRVQSLEKIQISHAEGYKDRVIVTLLNLEDVLSAGSIRYGDSVWLQLSVGSGDVSWEQGGVLGAKVRQAPQLKALGLLDDELIRDDAQAPAAVGLPVPVPAYLPMSRDDGDLPVDDAHSRARNRNAIILGKWTIQSAVCQHRNQKKKKFVYNNDEVYFEQDWFYIGADLEAGIAVLRQLPSPVIGKDTKPGDYAIERRGVWKLHLLDLNGGGAGLSLAQQQMECLLLRAKAQLKQSKRMRAGQTKSYGPHLRGGTGFTAQLRAQVATSTRQIESRCADQQERRLQHIHRHLNNKYQRINVALGLKNATALTQRSSCHLNSCASASSIMQENDPRQEQKSKLSSIDDHWEKRNKPILKSATVGNLKRLLVLKSSDAVSSCALCNSSSIKYDLCCQYRDVIQTLEQERVDELRARQTHSEGNLFLERNRASKCKVSHNTRSGDTMTLNGISSIENTIRQEGNESLCCTNSTNASTDALGLSGRSFRLFAKEDEVMVSLIKYKKKEAIRALDEQSRVSTTLSPMAARFRDRFKHVGLFVQMHKKQQEVEEDKNS